MSKLRRIVLLLVCFLMLVSLTCTAGAADPITITSQPKSVMVANGSAATVKVSASGSGLSYQWYRKLAKETSFSATGVTKPEYSVTMSYENSGQHVYCRITDANGNSVNSGFAVLNSSDIGITFTSTLSDRRVTPMASVTVRPYAKGPIWKYTWYRSYDGYGSYFYDYNKDYNILVRSKGSIQYAYCVVTSHAGYTVATNIAKFTTNEPKIIDCSPKEVIVTAGETFTLFVNATGDDLTYNWTTSPSYSSFLPDAEYRRDASLTLTMTKEMSGKYFYCKITDSHYNVVETHDIYVRLPALEITKQPEGSELVAGMNAVTSIAANGEEVRYQWYSSYEGAEYVPLSCTSPDLSVKLTEPGEYRIYCEITDKSNQTRKSTTVYFTAYAPVYIKKDVVDNKARVGTDVGFSFQAEGCGVTYQWYCKQPGSSAFSPISGATGTSCFFTMDSNSSGTQVYCIATDTAGNTVRSSTAAATIDSSLHISGNCSTCGGDGNCNKCGGDMWYTGFKWVYGSDGLPDSVLVTELCNAVYCTGGSCSKCGGDGWIGEKTTAGDADGNGSVNSLDVLRVLQYAAGWDVSIDTHSSDVNNNNAVEPYDAVLILQNIAGK